MVRAEFLQHRTAKCRVPKAVTCLGSLRQSEKTGLLERSEQEEEYSEIRSGRSHKPRGRRASEAIVKT